MGKRKIVLPTFEVVYWNEVGEEEKALQVRPVPLDKLEEVKKLQEILIQVYVDCDGCLSEALKDTNSKNTMKTLAQMLPVIGQTKPGFDIEPLYDSGDIIQLGQIFFSESIDANMKSQGIKTDPTTQRPIYHFPEHRYNPTPSAIARIHDLPFFDKYQDKRDKRIQEQLAQEQLESKKKLNLREANTVT